MTLKYTLSLLLTLAVALRIQAEPPANFTVKSPVDGKSFTLSESKGRYVALHFLLKTECPVCLAHTRSFAQKADQVAGVTHVFLKPDSEAEIKSWAENLPGASVPTIYQDPGATLAEQFGIPDGYQFHGQSVHFPALILLNPAGKEVFRYVGKNNGDRFSFEKFAEKMAQLSRSREIAQFNLPGNRLAIQGFDPVAYFQLNQAVKGNPAIASQYQGVTYHFASEKNRADFALAPQRYTPAYGGWCATAMAKGKKVEIDPASFKITKDRLFLFYKGLFADALKEWNAGETSLTVEADSHWKTIVLN